MVKKLMLLILITFLVFFFSNCMNLRIEHDIDYPAKLFQQTQKKIDKLQQQNRKRKGVNAIHLLIYDGEDRELIGFSVGIDSLDQVSDYEDGFKSNQFIKIDLDKLDLGSEILPHISRLPAGLLLEVEEREEKTHVLIWLD